MIKQGSSDAVRFSYRHRSGSTSPWITKEYVLQNSYFMETFNHARSKKGTYITGGPFYLKTVNHRVVPDVINHLRYEGPVIQGEFTGVASLAAQADIADSDLIARGATAISRCAPNVPEFSLATQFGELKERFPSIIGSSLMRDQVSVARAAGNEYLNVEFGWKPLVGAVKDFARQVKRGNAVVRSYSAGSFQHTRRRYSFPTEQTTTYNNDNGGSLRPVESPVGARGSFNQVVSEDTWFSGAWVRYVPLGDSISASLRRAEQEADKLLGTRLTPSVLWELAPWSWGVDWFSNVGDVITNISSIGDDAMAMKYGYVMNHRRSSRQAVQERTTAPVLRVYRETTYDTKIRMPASPYGFGVDWDGMSPRQIAIATALGLSRS